MINDQHSCEICKKINLTPLGAYEIAIFAGSGTGTDYVTSYIFCKECLSPYGGSFLEDCFEDNILHGVDFKYRCMNCECKLSITEPAVIIYYGTRKLSFCPSCFKKTVGNNFIEEFNIEVREGEQQ